MHALSVGGGSLARLYNNIGDSPIAYQSKKPHRRKSGSATRIVSKATAIDGQYSRRRIPAFGAWLVVTIVFGVAVLVLFLLLLSREPNVVLRDDPVPPEPALPVETLAEAERLRIQAEATVQDLRDVLRSVAAYECPAGAVAYSPDRFEAVRQRAVAAVEAIFGYK